MKVAHGLTKSWVWLHLVSFIALALQQSEPAIYLGRYSQNAVIMLGGLALSLPAAWWAAAQAPRLMSKWQPPAKLGWGLLGGIAAGLFLLWAAPVASAPAYLVIRFYLSVIGVTVGLWSASNEQAASWTDALLPAVVLTLSAAFGLLVTGFPGVRWIDEGYSASLAWNFAHTGSIEPIAYDYVNTEFYGLVYIILGYWMRLFGSGLWSTRVYIYLVGLTALLITLITIWRIYGRSPAWFGALLGVFALVPLNILRHDIMVAVYLSLAVLFYYHAEKSQRTWLHLWVGFFVAYAIDGHPNAYRFSIGFGIAYLIEWAMLWHRKGHRTLYWPLLYLVAGGILGVLAYLGLYTTLGDQILDQASDPFLAVEQPFYVVFIQQLQELIKQIPILFGAACLGAVIGLRQRDSWVRVLTIVLLVDFAIIATLYGYYRSYYVAQLIGLLVFLTAPLFARVEPKLRLGLLILLVAANAGLLLNRYNNGQLRENYNDALIVGEQLRQIIPAGSTVVAIDPMYFGLVDHVTFQEYAVGPWGALRYEKPEIEVWEEIGADYVVVVHEHPAPPSEILQLYMQQQSMLSIACWDSERIGRVDLFTLPTNAPRLPRGERHQLIDPLTTQDCKPMG